MLATVFFSYSHADEALRDQLEKQLAMLKRQGVIETWHDRRIGAGAELDAAISSHVERDDIILLLISYDFLASDYCYDKEMLRAMARHEAGEAIVIPVILRACDWHSAPFGKLMATPPDGKPVTQWADRDQALLEVARAIRNAAEQVAATRGRRSKPAEPQWAAAPSTDPAALSLTSLELGPRSSNLRLAKQFTDRDRDRFKLDTFEFIARFFENSLEELGKRNTGIDGHFRRIDANRFTAAIYRDGTAVARGTIFMGGDRYMGNGIAYVQGEGTQSNGYNESLSVEADDQALFLKSMGMSAMGGRNGEAGKLSQEGAAELYWGMLMSHLQQLR